MRTDSSFILPFWIVCCTRMDVLLAIFLQAVREFLFTFIFIPPSRCLGDRGWHQDQCFPWRIHTMECQSGTDGRASVLPYCSSNPEGDGWRIRHGDLKRLVIKSSTASHARTG